MDGYIRKSKALGEISKDTPDRTDVDRITERIIGCAHEVSNTLGTGFVEKIYENALAHEMRKGGLRVDQQYPINVIYAGIIAGEFFADMLVEDKVLVELKAVSALTDEHLAQALNYLRAACLPACLLINFGQSKIQVRRLHPLHPGKYQRLNSFLNPISVYIVPEGYPRSSPVALKSYS